MYSLILLASLTTSADNANYVFPRARAVVAAAASGGCSGRQLGDRAVELARKATVTVQANRPHLFARVAAAAKAAPKAGCVGGSVTSTTVTKTVTKTTVAPAPAPAPVAASGLLQRAAVHRTLHKALRQGKLTPAQAAVAKRALEDPEIYSAAVRKVTTDLNKLIAKRGMSAAAIGDGTLLRLLLDNLDAIIAAIIKIIDALSMSDFQPMPAGPYPPAHAMPPLTWLAC